MGKKKIPTQDGFLKACIENKAEVTVFLTKGPQMRGIISGFDEFSMVLTTADGRDHFILKQVVASIVPTRRIKWSTLEAEKKR